MRAPGVVEFDPVTDDPTGMLPGLAAVEALFFQRPDHALHQAVLLRAVWRDKLLLQAVSAYQSRITATGRNGLLTIFLWKSDGFIRRANLSGPLFSSRAIMEISWHEQKRTR